MKQSWPTVLRDAIEAAQAQTRDLKHGYLGTEHLLLGFLAREETAAAQRVIEAGGSWTEVRSRLVGIVGLGEEEFDVRRLPYTVNAAAVCDRIVSEADRFGAQAVGTEHVLRAILRRRSIAYHVLADLGADPDAVAGRVPRLRRIES